MQIVYKTRDYLKDYQGYGKTGRKRHATFLTTLPQNDLNSDVARFTTHIKPVLQQIRLLTGLNEGGKTRNVAVQLVFAAMLQNKSHVLPKLKYSNH